MSSAQIPSPAKLASEVRSAFAAQPAEGEKAVEELLQLRLQGLAPEKRLEVLDRLQDLFLSGSRDDFRPGDEVLAGVCQLLLGRKPDVDKLDPDELSRRLAEAINTVFDALNRVIGVINKTLARDSGLAQQTIRRVIGDSLETEGSTRSLEAHLGQIAEAFLRAHEAFKAAARTKVGQILDALDPKALAAERSGGIKIGPLRKAEDYEILVEKIERIRKWYDSGKFMEEFLREFEQNCQQDK